MFYVLVPLAMVLSAMLYGAVSYEEAGREGRNIRIARDVVAACDTMRGQFDVSPARCEESRHIAVYGSANVSKALETVKLCKAREDARGEPSADFAASCAIARQDLAAMREKANKAAGTDLTKESAAEAESEKPLGLKLVAVSLGTMTIALWISSLIRRRRQKAAAT